MQSNNNNLLKEDILNFSLYHGTSSIFKDSIITHGLGAINPLEGLEIFSFLKHAYKLYHQIFSKNTDYDWIGDMTCKKIISQEVTKGGFNFRHASLYLTPSEKQAVQYANKKFGSEVLSLAAKMYIKLIQHDHEIAHELEFRESPVVNLIKQESYPILLEAKNIQISTLKKECGESPIETIETIKKYKDEPSFEAIIGQLNFECTKPILLEQLKLYKINIPDINSHCLRYTLQEIII